MHSDARLTVRLPQIGECQTSSLYHIPMPFASRVGMFYKKFTYSRQAMTNFGEWQHESQVAFHPGQEGCKKRKTSFFTPPKVIRQSDG